MSDSDISKELAEIRKLIKNTDSKIDAIMEKIQEFEIILDAAELFEQHMDNSESEYKKDWSPYDEDYPIDDYGTGYDDGYYEEDEEDHL